MLYQDYPSEISNLGIKFRGWPAIILTVKDDSSSYQGEYDAICGKIQLLPRVAARFVDGGKPEDLCLDAYFSCSKKELCHHIVSLGEPVHVLVTGDLDKRYKATYTYNQTKPVYPEFESLNSHCRLTGVEYDYSQGTRGPLIAAHAVSDPDLLSKMAGLRFADFCTSCSGQMKNVPGDDKKFCPRCWV